MFSADFRRCKAPGNRLTLGVAYLKCIAYGQTAGVGNISQRIVRVVSLIRLLVIIYPRREDTSRKKFSSASRARTTDLYLLNCARVILYNCETAVFSATSPTVTVRF